MRPLTSLSDRQVVKLCDLNTTKVQDKPTRKFSEQTEELAVKGTPTSAWGP